MDATSQYENDAIEATEEEIQQDMLMNEQDILMGMFEAANFKDDQSNWKKIQIKRNEKVLFEFRVRPLNEEEIGACRKKATKFMPNPMGKQYPRIEADVDYVKLRSYKILEATVEEDQRKVWGNKAIKEKLNVLQDIDVVDSVLMAGEKDWVADIIDEISGYGVSREDYTKN